jgi:hypothetical protein
MVPRVWTVRRIVPRNPYSSHNTYRMMLKKKHSAVFIEKCYCRIYFFFLFFIAKKEMNWLVK